MKLIIDIDEDVRVAISRMGLLRITDEMQKKVDEAIQLGIPLPKGHGRLGDLSKIYDRLNDAQIEGSEEYKGLGEAKQIICDAPTIIEADKTESEKSDTESISE